MPEIRGLIVQSRLNYLEKLSDPKIMRKTLQKLPEDIRYEISEQIFPVNAYPFRYLSAIDETLMEVSPLAPEELFEQIGAQFSDLIVDRYFHLYSELGQPTRFLNLLSALYCTLWGFGEYQPDTSEYSAHLRFFYPVSIPKSFCLFQQSFLKKSLDHCGAQKIKLIERECMVDNKKRCVYDLEWEPGNR